MILVCELPLRGAGGEPVSFARTIHSHGCARLAPAELQDEPLEYRRSFRVGGRVVEIAMQERDGRLVAHAARKLRERDAEAIAKSIGRMFRLDDDLSPFYARIAEDEPLAWAAHGAGRMLASPSVFEDVIKTICTTNCAWSATIRMTQALSDLGGGAFPESEVLAGAPDAWYRDVARMGYRGAYVKAIARDVARRTLDLEALRDREILDADVERNAARTARDRALRRRARHAAARAPQAARPRLVDAPEVPAADREEAGGGLDDTSSLCALRRVCRPGVLALSDARLD